MSERISLGSTGSLHRPTPTIILAVLVPVLEVRKGEGEVLIGIEVVYVLRRDDRCLPSASIEQDRYALEGVLTALLFEPIAQLERLFVSLELAQGMSLRAARR